MSAKVEKIYFQKNFLKYIFGMEYLKKTTI